MSRPSTKASYMLDPLPVPAYIWDLAAERFIGWNERFRELLGYSAEELRVLDWRNLVVADEIHIAQRAIESGPEMQRVRWHWRTKGERVIAVTLAARQSAFVDDNDDLRAVYIGLVTEIGTSGPIAASDAF